MKISGRTALVAGATGDLGRALLRLAGRRTWSVHDLHAWQVLKPLHTRYVPWSWSALRPSGLVAILNDVCLNDHRTVLECGGGISTLYIARLLRERGGHLTTLEHDARWCEFLTQELKTEQLDGVVTVCEAPLEPWPEDATLNWYAGGVVESAVAGGDPIQLLIVDGPPAYRGDISRARYPALPALAPYLALDATVVLDDIERRGEQDVVKRWDRESSFRFVMRPDPGGIAIGRNPAYPIAGN